MGRLFTANLDTFWNSFREKTFGITPQMISNGLFLFPFTTNTFKVHFLFRIGSHGNRPSRNLKATELWLEKAACCGFLFEQKNLHPFPSSGQEPALWIKCRKKRAMAWAAARFRGDYICIYILVSICFTYKNKICIYDWIYNWLMILYSAALANIWQWHEKRIPKLQNLWLSFHHVILALYWKSMSTLFKRFNSKPPTLIPWSSLARWLPAASWPTREEVMKIVVDIHMI